MRNKTLVILNETVTVKMLNWLVLSEPANLNTVTIIIVNGRTISVTTTVSRRVVCNSSPLVTSLSLNMNPSGAVAAAKLNRTTMRIRGPDGAASPAVMDLVRNSEASVLVLSMILNTVAIILVRKTILAMAGNGQTPILIPRNTPSNVLVQIYLQRRP